MIELIFKELATVAIAKLKASDEVIAALEVTQERAWLTDRVAELELLLHAVILDRDTAQQLYKANEICSEQQDELMKLRYECVAHAERANDEHVRRLDVEERFQRLEYHAKELETKLCIPPSIDMAIDNANASK